jgi:hypothetical protein
MPAPSRLRDAYIVGRAGSYTAPTLPACERLITQMTELLRSDLCARDSKLKARVEWDRDLVLERWLSINFAQHAAEAMRASK